MPEREIEPDGDGPLALLHQLAGRVVDCGDVVGVDRMAQAEGVGEERRAEQDRIVAQRDERPDPDQHVRADQEPVDADQSTAKFRIATIPDA